VRRAAALAPYLAPLPALLWVWRRVLTSPASLLPVNPMGDMPARFAPLRRFGFAELAEGRLALWNPRVLGGVPHLGGSESGLLYPPAWLQLVLPEGAALNAQLFLHLWLAAALTAFWARRLGASRAGAALAGLAWMLGGALLPRLYAGHLTVLCALAWAPLVYAAVDGWLEEERVHWPALGAAALALQVFAGSAQTAYMTGLGALLYGLPRLRGRRGLSRAAAGLGAIPALALLASAAQLFPAAEAAAESARAAAGAGFSASFALPWENLPTLLSGRWLGGGALPYFGRLYWWEASLYCGAAVALLAWACPQRKRGALLGAAAALLVLSLGAGAPLLLGVFRGAAKFSAQALLLVCAAAGLGLGALEESAARRRLGAAAAALGTSLMIAGAFCWPGTLQRLLAFIAGTGQSFADPSLYADRGFLGLAVQSSVAGFWTAAGACFAAAAALRWGRPALLAGLASVELLAFASSPAAVCAPQQPVPEPLAAALSADPGEHRFLTDWTLHPNLGMVLGRDEIWGYDQLPLRRWAELAAWTQGRPPEGAGLYQRLEPSPRLALLRLRHFLVEGRPPLALRAAGDAPRAFLARARRSPAGGDLELMSAAGFDFRREAAWTGASFETRSGASSLGWLTLRELSTDALEVEAQVGEPCLLVVTDAYASGWTARALEGASQERYDVVPVDHGLRGVPLAPGSHRLRLEYEPKTWRLGLFASALGLAALLFLALNSQFAQKPHKH
jgi:hypothetical protein